MSAARKRPWARVIILGGLAAVGPLSIDMYLPAFPRIAADLSSSASAVQLSLTACLAGLAAGQLIAGPLSDSFGRRGPLLVGLAGYAAASVLCGLAPSVPILVFFRLLQGLFGAAGLVIGRAIVRDLYEGVEAVRFFSLLVIVFGLAPILAPALGAQILRVGGWREIFLALSLIAAALLLLVLIRLPETLRPEHRQELRLGSSLRTMAMLLRHRGLVVYSLASGLTFAAMFAYISGSPFVIQNIYGASPQLFSYVFGFNALGFTLLSQVNGRLAGRITPQALLAVGLTASCVAGVALAAVVLGGIPGLAVLIVPLFLLVASMSFIAPNATALALADHPETAGAASGLLGVLQFVVAAAAAPLVGVAGPDTAVPMALVIAVTTLGAGVSYIWLAPWKHATRLPELEGCG